MNKSTIYLSIIQKLEKIAHEANIILDNDAQIISKVLIKLFTVKYNEEKAAEDERDRNFQPLGFVFDEDGNERIMNEDELVQAALEAEEIDAAEKRISQ